MVRVLVFGATGNIGGAVAKALAEHYKQVPLRLASSRETGVALLRERFPSAEVIKADWNIPKSLDPALLNIDKVFVVTQDVITNENIVTPNIINAVRKAGSVAHIVRLLALPEGVTQLDDETMASRIGTCLSLIAKPLLDASGLKVTYINVPSWISFSLDWLSGCEIRAHRRLALPAVIDTPRLWLDEEELGLVAAKILTEAGDEHVGKEYVLTGTERLDFVQIAELLSDILGEKVTYSDEIEPLRAVLGDHLDPWMTFFRHEVPDYSHVVPTDTIARFLGRPQADLAEYLRRHKSDFL